MKKLIALEKAYVAYTIAMEKLHAKYYPTPGQPLVGNRQEYLDKWGKLTERYKNALRKFGEAV